MEDTEAVERETLGGERLVALYPPSWIDRLTDRVDRLTGPSWIFYVGLWLVLYFVEIVIQWTNGATGQFYFFHLYFVGAFPLYLALMHYLDRTAAAALDKFRAVLDCSDAEFAHLRYRLTTLPARWTLLASVIGIAYGVIFVLTSYHLDLLQIFHFADAPVSLYYNSAILFLISGVGVVLIYHTVHQLIAVSRIYRRVRVNLFKLGPLYAFSDLSARTAIGLLVITYAWYSVIPDFFNEPTSVVLIMLPIIIVMLTFIMPLLGVHNLLAEEKARLLAGWAQRQEMTIGKLHERIDTDKIEGMDDLSKAMTSLEIEYRALSHISTWPWQAETLRWFMAALLFPVFVWLSQQVLQRVLGP